MIVIFLYFPHTDNQIQVSAFYAEHNPSDYD